MNSYKPVFIGMSAIFAASIALVGQATAAEPIKDAPIHTASTGLVASSLKKQSYFNIDITGTAGPFIEAEACRKSTHYYLQMNRKGQVLQKTRLGECSRDTVASNKEKQKNQDIANKHAKAVGGEVIPVRTNGRQAALIYPDRNKRVKTAGLSGVQMLRKRGYKHIYAPRHRSVGILACKGGVEYAFDVGRQQVSSWKQMRQRRKAFGKCFGYGKQIRNRRQLKSIMRSHGDTHIKIVRGNLPMFEAYSCLNGKRRHVKINRWGNDNVRVLGKCK